MTDTDPDPTTETDPETTTDLLDTPTLGDALSGLVNASRYCDQHDHPELAETIADQYQALGNATDGWPVETLTIEVPVDDLVPTWMIQEIAEAERERQNLGNATTLEALADAIDQALAESEAGYEADDQGAR